MGNLGHLASGQRLISGSISIQSEKKESSSETSLSDYQKAMRDCRARGLIPASEAAKKAGCCRRTFERLRIVLALRPHVDARRTSWFTEGEIDRIAKAFIKRRHDGSAGVKIRASQFTLAELESVDHAKNVFCLFQQGKGPREVVGELGTPPTIVEHLWQRWGTIEGGFFISPKEARMFTGFPWSDAGAIETGKDLVEALQQEFALKREESKCLRCRQRPRKVCETCVKQSIAKVEEAYTGLPKIKT
jgi:hypothetical protein